MLLKILMQGPQNTDGLLLEQADQAIIQLKAIKDDPRWIKFSQSPCLMFKMQIGSRLLSKGQLIIPLSMSEIAQKLSDQKIMYSLNPQLKQITTLHKIPSQPQSPQKKEARVNYMRYSGIWPVQDRDFVNISIKQSEPHQILIASKVSKYPYPTPAKVVRAVCNIAGYILEEQAEKSTKLTYISDVELNGSIPWVFQNKLSERQAAMPKQIERVLMGQRREQEQQEDIKIGEGEEGKYY